MDATRGRKDTASKGRAWQYGRSVAVAVVKASNIVGYVVMDYSRVFWYFIQKRHSSIVSVRLEDLHVCLKSETRSEANLRLCKTTRVASTTTLVTTGSSQSQKMTIIIFLFLGSDN